MMMYVHPNLSFVRKPAEEGVKRAGAARSCRRRGGGGGGGQEASQRQRGGQGHAAHTLVEDRAEQPVHVITPADTHDDAMT